MLLAEADDDYYYEAQEHGCSLLFTLTKMADDQHANECGQTISLSACLPTRLKQSENQQKPLPKMIDIDQDDTSSLLIIIELA